MFGDLNGPSGEGDSPLQVPLKGKWLGSLTDGLAWKEVMKPLLGVSFLDWTPRVSTARCSMGE